MKNCEFRHTVVLGCLLLLPIPGLAGDIVCLEAESADAIVAPARVAGLFVASSEAEQKVARAASGEKYAEIPREKKADGDEAKTNAPACFDPKTGTNVVTFTFEVSNADRYALWCRAWWSDECGNSFFMSIDDSQVFTFGQDGVYKRWHWVRAPKGLKQLVLAKGKHSLQIKIRETGVRLDQVLFVRDPKYVPVGIEGE